MGFLKNRYAQNSKSKKRNMSYIQLINISKFYLKEFCCGECLNIKAELPNGAYIMSVLCVANHPPECTG